MILFEVCEHRFVNEALSEPLQVLSQTNKATGGVLTINSSADECRLRDGDHPGINLYLDCDGEWKSLSSSVVQQKFKSSWIWTKNLNVEVKVFRRQFQ